MGTGNVYGRKWGTLIPAIVTTVALAGCGATNAPSQGASSGGETPAPASAYQDGDRVTIVVPFDPGGGYDTYARSLQPCIEESLQEVTGTDVGVVVENVVGGGGQIAAEQIFRAEPDGSQVMIHGHDIIVTQQIIEGANFDVTQFTPVAQVANQSRSLLVREGVVPEGGTFLDLAERSQEEPVLWGGAGLAVQQQLLFHLLNEAGVAFEVDIVEFEGTGEAVASMLREELEVYFVSTETAAQTAEANPEISVLLNMGGDDELTPEADTPTSLGIENASAIENTIGRSIRGFWGPPEMDEGASAALEDAFEAALTDSECASDAAEAGNTVVFASPEDLQTVIEETLELYEANADVLE